MKYENIELIDTLAAEYVLGTLQGRARSRFQRLILERPGIRQAVAAWEMRLNKLAGTEPAIAPPAATWQALEQRLFGASTLASEQTDSARPRWYDQVAFWRGFSLSSGLLAAVLAAILVIYYPQQTEPTGPDYVLVLNDTQANPVWTVSTNQAMDQFQVRNLKPMPMPENKGCVLWLQPKGADTMYALGRLPDDGSSVQLAIKAQLKQMLENGKLMVTIENMDEPTHDKPSGNIESAGRLVPLQQI